MKSFLSTLLFGLLLSLLSLPNVFVDARINSPFPADAIKVESTAKEQLQRSLIATTDTMNGVRALIEGNHRTLGGGVESYYQRDLIQEQTWARDDEGNILWWIWLIIAICCFICLFVCCWSSACCLRD